MKKKKNNMLTQDFMLKNMWSKYIKLSLVNLFFNAVRWKYDRSQLIVTTDLFFWKDQQQKQTHNNQMTEFKWELTTDENCKFYSPIILSYSVLFASSCQHTESLCVFFSFLLEERCQFFFSLQYFQCHSQIKLFVQM